LETFYAVAYSFQDLRMAPALKFGQYTVLSSLGKGGMGEVWRARDQNLGREVAIKTLPEAFARDREQRSE
jgi:serine/threonine-protein kinase